MSRAPCAKRLPGTTSNASIACHVRRLRLGAAEGRPMRAKWLLGLVGALSVWLPSAPIAQAQPVQLGPRPFYLVDQMAEGPLKQKLAQCTGPFRKADFSIGHRGAPLQFPEHTRE